MKQKVYRSLKENFSHKRTVPTSKGEKEEGEK